MKLETKRFLAKEWLILLGLTVILFLSRDGWLWWNVRISDRMVQIEAEAVAQKDISDSQRNAREYLGEIFYNDKKNFESQRNWENEAKWVGFWGGCSYLGLWVVRATAGAAGVLFGRRKPDEGENNP